MALTPLAYGLLTALGLGGGVVWWKRRKPPALADQFKRPQLDYARQNLAAIQAAVASQPRVNELQTMGPILYVAPQEAQTSVTGVVMAEAVSPSEGAAIDGFVELAKSIFGSDAGESYRPFAIEAAKDNTLHTYLNEKWSMFRQDVYRRIATAFHRPVEDAETLTLGFVNAIYPVIYPASFPGFRDNSKRSAAIIAQYPPVASTGQAELSQTSKRDNYQGQARVMAQTIGTFGAWQTFFAACVAAMNDDASAVNAIVAAIRKARDAQQSSQPASKKESTSIEAITDAFTSVAKYGLELLIDKVTP